MSGEQGQEPEHGPLVVIIRLPVHCGYENHTLESLRGLRALLISRMQACEIDKAQGWEKSMTIRSMQVAEIDGEIERRMLRNN